MTVEIRVGDCLASLRLMPEDSVDCVVTSPPYWGLRDYGVTGQIGLEGTLGGHMTVLVGVFREVRRVLKPSGTLWFNYGDAYACQPNGRSAAATKEHGADDRTFRDKPMSTIGGVLKPKDRMLLPARAAIALQEDGWWLRDEIIWHKPNPMPSSVKDRTTPAHEMVYMFSKAPRYFYDSAAIRTPPKASTVARLSQDVDSQEGSRRANGGVRADRPMKALRGRSDKQRGHSRLHAGFNDRWDHMERAEQIAGGANKRSVWTIAPAPFREAHFATFPPALVEPCLLAGCPAGGVVLDPFGGAGTTGLVAQRLGRHAILLELNPEYAAIAQRRIDAEYDPFA